MLRFSVSLVFIACLLLPNISHPQDAQACLDQGLKCVRNYQYDRAIYFYRQSLGYSPDFADANFNMGKCYIMKGNYIKAMNYYLEVVAHEKKYAGDAYNSIGLCYELMRDYDRALEYYSKSIRSFESDSSAAEKLMNLYLIMGQVNAEKKNYMAALRYLDMALALDPANGKTFNIKGYVLEEMSKFEKAIHYFQKAVDTGVDKEIALYNMALAYGRMGDKIKEAENYKKSAELGHVGSKRWMEINAK